MWVFILRKKKFDFRAFRPRRFTNAVWAMGFALIEFGQSWRD